MKKGVATFITRAVDALYIPPVRRYIPLQMFRYAACGALNVALSWVLYFLIFHYIVRERNVDAGFFVFSGHVATQVVVFVIITATGFLLNRYVAFPDSPLRGRTQLGRYLLSTLGSWALNVSLLKLFADALHIWPTPSFVIATLIGIVYSYLMQKHFSFRGSGGPDGQR